MGNLYSRYKTDTGAEESGVWAPWPDDVELKIASFGNPEHRKIMDDLREPHQALLGAGRDLPKDVADEITAKSLAGGVLKDWRGVKDENGADLPYTVENAERVLRDLPRLRDEVSAFALRWQNYRNAALEVDLGNSAAGSDGGSTGATKPTGS